MREIWPGAQRLITCGVLWSLAQAGGCDCGVEATPGTDAVGCYCVLGFDDERDGVPVRRCGRGEGTDCGQTVTRCIPPGLVPAGETTEAGLTLFSDAQMFELCEEMCTRQTLAAAQQVQDVFDSSGTCLVRSNQIPHADDVGVPSLRGLQPADGLLVQSSDRVCRATLPDGGPSNERLACPTTACDVALAVDGALNPLIREELKECTVYEASEDTPDCGEPTYPTMPPVCLSPINDPPPITGPLVPFIVPMSPGVVDPLTSSVVLFVEGGPEEGIESQLSGSFFVVGRTCANGDGCGIGFSTILEASAATVPYSIGGAEAGSIELRNTVISAQSNFDAIQLDGNGLGVLSPIDLAGTIQADVHPSIVGFGDPAPARIAIQPSADVLVAVNWAAGSVTLTGALSYAEDLARVPPTPAIDAVFTINVDLTAGPPEVDAGENMVIECSVDEPTVVLDASGTSDPDDDLIGIRWYRVGPDGSDEFVGDGTVVEASQAIGNAEYAAVASDSRYNMSWDTVSVTVEDTTPPVLSDLVNDGPACLWSPRHDYVVLRLGHEIDAMVDDACDAAPVLSIVGAESNQPDNDVGDGDTVNDVVVFSDRVCLRAERQGTSPEGRLYTLHVGAVDASGNATTEAIEVRVARDQRPGADCPLLPAELFVDDGDPLCAPAAAPYPGEDNERAAPSCGSVSSPAASLPLFALFTALGLLARRPRKRGWPAFGLALILGAMLGCTGESTADTELESCVVGVWTPPDRIALACPASDCFECQQPDCRVENFEWFRDDGTYVHGFISWSEETGTFSTTGTPIVGEWALTDATLETDGLSAEASCSRDELVWSGSRRERSTDTALSAFQDAFASRTAEGTWSGKRYAQP